MTAMNMFSVVICSIDPWNFAQVGTCYARLLQGFPHEIIGIHDARSLAEGYNRGLKRARGDIVIFSHDDVLFLDKEFAQKIATRMQVWDVLGFAGASRLVQPAWYAALDSTCGAVCHWNRTNPCHLSFTVYGARNWPVTGGIQALDGICMIARKEVATTVGFDSDTFDGWHLYDLDFSFATYLADYKIGVCCDIPYVHAAVSMKGEQSHYLSASYAKYAECFLRKYGHKQEIMPFDEYSARTTRCLVNNHKSLIKLWTEDVFRRAALSINRRYKERI
jgi:glycosyltransferase involved in cell wall biosynthesis